MMQENTAKSFLSPKLVSLMKEEVSRIRKAELPVNRAFEAIAEKSGLKYNTVRNYYYRYIYGRDDIKTSEDRNKEKTGITGRTFTEDEVRELIRAMLVGQGKGKSVRGCANELAKNDYRLMLRYQNKYRNVLAGNPEYIEKIMEELSMDGQVYYNPFTKEIIRGYNIVPEKRMFEIIGKMVSNINEINSRALDGLLMGLYELSDLALRYKKQNIGEMVGVLSDGEESPEIGYRLAKVNRDFLALSPTEKLAGLTEYIEKIEKHIEEMGAGL